MLSDDTRCLKFDRFSDEQTHYAACSHLDPNKLLNNMQSDSRDFYASKISTEELPSSTISWATSSMFGSGGVE